MAVSANQVRAVQPPDRGSAPLAATTQLYEGTLGFTNTSGLLVGTTGSGANRFAGLLAKEADNSAGAAGDVKAELITEGIAELPGTGFSQASVGKDAYATDNFTVSAGYAANGVKIGKIEAYVSSTKVRVRFDVQAQNQGAVIAIGGGMKLARGQLTTVTATDTVVTGLATVVSVVASYETDPADANSYVSAQIGDQAGAPAAGSIIIKTWKQSGTDPTPIAADAFSKKVNWIAIGT